jgi:hypothetical protein
MLSLYLRLSVLLGMPERLEDLPIIVDGLDDEPQGRADRVDILAHDLLDDCGLSRVVQAPKKGVSQGCSAKPWKTHSIRIRISLSFSRAFLRMESMMEQMSKSHVT